MLFLQGTDGRIIFAIPYENDFTLIGTTDAEHSDLDAQPTCTDAEADYLRGFASEYFAQPIEQDDIVWTYSGVRPLFDDGASSATAATREYVLRLNDSGAPLLNVFGGKITTYRKLAEAALAKIARYFVNLPGDWTAGVALPGGDFPVDGVPSITNGLMEKYPFLDAKWTARLVRTYGTLAADVLGEANSVADLGTYFGENLYAREVEWAIENEWVRSAEDLVWRRTKLGLTLSRVEVAEIEAHILSILENSAVPKNEFKSSRLADRV